jgi:hypothetical protein
MNRHPPLPSPRHEATSESPRNGQWPCFFETTHIATLKKMVCNMRSHCSFMNVMFRRDGVHWVGTSAVDHLHLHVHMPNSMFCECHMGRGQQTGADADTDEQHAPICVCEINMMHLYRIIKRATSSRYETLRFTINKRGVALDTTTTATSSAANYTMVMLRFATCNKQDMYHMRCSTIHIPSRHTQDKHQVLSDVVGCGGPGRSWGGCSPGWRVSSQQLHDALLRFDPESFHTVSFRAPKYLRKQNSESNSRWLSTTTATSPGRPAPTPHDVVEVLSHRNTTLTVRSKSDGFSGRVRIPVATVSANSRTSTTRPQAHTPTTKCRYNLTSVLASVQFARMNKTGLVNMAIVHAEGGGSVDAGDTWLKLEFGLKHLCQVCVLFPPVTHSCWWVMGDDTATSSSDSDSST